MVGKPACAARFKKYSFISCFWSFLRLVQRKPFSPPYLGVDTISIARASQAPGRILP